MPNLPTPVIAFARSHHGLVTREVQAANDVGRHRRQRLIDDGLLVRAAPGVDRLASHPITFEQQCLLACLAHPGLVVSGPSAGRLLGLRRMPDGPVHCMSLRRKIEVPDVVVHRTTVLGRHDIDVRPDGIRVLKPVRLVPDLARFLDDTDLESVIEQLLQQRRVSIPALCASARRLRACGRDGIVRLGRVLDRRPMWMKPKDSNLEVVLLRALADRGLALVPQHRVDVGDGIEIHLDGADPLVGFGVEVDHETWHGGRLAVARDKWRDRKAARIGWVVARVTDSDVDTRLAEVVEDLVEIHAECLRRRAA